ncbi:MAG: hypothetical protein IPL79_19890 [Myxococcales bacterium]|nr:hypothetical protein [Myxococcales bacterium]
MIDLPTLDGARSAADVTRLLGQWRDRLTQALRSPPTDPRGVLLKGVDLSTTPVSISHGLPSLSGWLVVRARGAAPASVVETGVSARTLTLVASGAVTVDLWVWP